MLFPEFERPPAELVLGFAALATATVSNALDKLCINGVMRNLKPVVAGLRCAGPAVTVHEVTGELGSAEPDALPLGRLVDAARPGDVIVIDNGGAQVSTWGGVVSFAAAAKGIAGLVVDGAVRDVDDIREAGFAAFSRHVVPITGKGRIRVLAVNGTVRADGVRVRAGDIVVADGSGVVCVPVERAGEVLDLARVQDAVDRKVVDGVRDGLSLDEAMRRAGVL